MFGRLDSVLHSEVRTLGHPRAALLGFAVAVLAYNVLALLKAVTERVHSPTKAMSMVLPHDHMSLLTGYSGLRLKDVERHGPHTLPSQCGGTTGEDPPGFREGPGGPLHLAYLRAPDGNKLCALHRPARWACCTRAGNAALHPGRCHACKIMQYS